MNTTIESYVKRNAYSYIRFSSLGQIGNDSVRRQISRTVEFCQKHNLLLNETRYQDLGVSGWTGKNMETGALGAFLAAVKAKKVQPGSCLIVENWDRFSRLKPRIAYNKLAKSSRRVWMWSRWRTASFTRKKRWTTLPRWFRRWR